MRRETKQSISTYFHVFPRPSFTRYFHIFQFFIYVFLILGLSYADTVDKVIVVVNSETITQGELDLAVGAMEEKLNARFKGQELAKEIEKAKREVLDRMIEEKLILCEAKKKAIPVSETEKEEKLKEVKSKFESVESFDEALRQEGVSVNELKEKYAEQIMVTKLIEEEVRKKLQISPSEILEYYSLHKGDFTKPEQIKLKNILIKADENLKDEEAAMLAEKVLGFLKAGESFDELAIKYSQGPNRDMGGDIGFVKRGQMLKEIEEVVFNLKAGELSSVIKTSLGYHIFKLVEKRPEATKQMSEVKDEIEKILFFENGRKRYKEWIEELKKDAYISYR